MRKFSARWWQTPGLLQWRYHHRKGDYPGPYWLFPSPAGTSLNWREL